MMVATPEELAKWEFGSAKSSNSKEVVYVVDKVLAYKLLALGIIIGIGIGFVMGRFSK